MIRVSSNMFPNTLVNQLAQIEQNQQQLQNEAATGLSVQFPSDDPSAMRRVLDMQAQASNLAQYQTNIATLKDQSTAAYTAMQSLQTISDRASEIATSADGTASPQELASDAAEVTQLIQQAGTLMNTQNQGTYLFGGTVQNQPPYVLTTDSSGNVTSATYQGNTTVPSVEIAQGAMLSALPVGANTTGSGTSGLITDSRTGADFFNHLISLQNDLLAGNTTAISTTDSPALQADSQNIITQIASQGALQQRMDTATSTAASQATSLSQAISSQADADMSTVLVKLNATQTAYQAAIQSGATMLSTNLSLMDYLQ
jgi:flagellar hook-associated protein 3 FlgL